MRPTSTDGSLPPRDLLPVHRLGRAILARQAALRALQAADVEVGAAALDCRALGLHVRFAPDDREPGLPPVMSLELERSSLRVVPQTEGGQETGRPQGDDEHPGGWSMRV